MAGLFGVPRVGSIASAADNVQIGTSCYGKPVPIAYGLNRLAGNIIWAPSDAPFWSKIPGQQAGKGGYNPGSQDQYFQAMLIALCEGPIAGIGRVWRDKEVYTSLSADPNASGPWNLFLGARSQAPWTYFSSPTTEHKVVEIAGVTSFTISDPAFPSASLLSVVANYQYTRSHGREGDPETVHSSATLSPTTGTPGNNQYRVVGNVITIGFVNGRSATGIVVTYQTGKVLTAYAIGYGGTAYVASSRLSLGSSNSMRNYTFEVRGICSTNGDAHPADVLQDFLTNTTYGCGMAAGTVVTDAGQDGAAASSYRTYCTAMGFAISPILDQQRPASEIVIDLLKATNAEMVWSEGKLKIVPLGDTAVTAHGASYAPVTAPIYDLLPSDFLASSPTDERITVARVSQQQTNNSVPIEYMERMAAQLWAGSTAYVYGDVRQNGDSVYMCIAPGTSAASGGPAGNGHSIPDGVNGLVWQYQSAASANAYNVATVEYVEQADVNASAGQVRKASALQLHCITNQSHAQVISQILTRRSVYIRNTYTFRVGWRHSLLEPLDLVTLTDDLLGLDHVVARIRSIEESGEGELEITAEEWPFGVASATAYPTETPQFGGQDQQADPYASNPPVIFAPPLAATANGTPELWIGTSGSIKDWAGAQVYLSWDDSLSYEYVGDAGTAVYGVLGAAIAAGPPLDGVNTLVADVRVSDGTLTSVANSDRDALATACWVDGELIAYGTAALTGGGTYNLTSLRRGCRGTISSAHAASAPFMRIDGLFRIQIDPRRLGKTVYVKLVSFNLTRSYIADIATAPVYAYALPSAAERLPVAEKLPVKFTFDQFNIHDWDVISGSPAKFWAKFWASFMGENHGIPSLVTGGLDGGHALECSGYLALLHKTLIPVNDTMLFGLSAVYRQVSNPTSGGKNFQVGLVGVAENGATFVDLNGGNQVSNQHMIAAQSHDPGSWYELLGYWQGRSTIGTMGGVITAPGAFHTNVRYVRLLVVFNDHAGNGVQDLDNLVFYDATAEAAESKAGVANVTIYATSAPATRPDGSALVIGDLWFNTASSYAPFRWSGTQWITVHDGTPVVASEIAAGAVTADKIAANAITADKIAGNHIKTPNYAFTGTEGGADEVATAGAKMQNATGGTALLVAEANLKVGSLLMTQLSMNRAAARISLTSGGATTLYDALNVSSATYSGINLTVNLAVSLYSYLVISSVVYTGIGYRLAYGPVDTHPTYFKFYKIDPTTGASVNWANGDELSFILVGKLSSS